jgi:hypothetical protein
MGNLCGESETLKNRLKEFELNLKDAEETIV